MSDPVSQPPGKPASVALPTGLAFGSTATVSGYPGSGVFTPASGSWQPLSFINGITVIDGSAKQTLPTTPPSDLKILPGMVPPDECQQFWSPLHHFKLKGLPRPHDTSLKTVKAYCKISGKPMCGCWKVYASTKSYVATLVKLNIGGTLCLDQTCRGLYGFYKAVRKRSKPAAERFYVSTEAQVLTFDSFSASIKPTNSTPLLLKKVSVTMAGEPIEFLSSNNSKFEGFDDQAVCSAVTELVFRELKKIGLHHKIWNNQGQGPITKLRIDDETEVEIGAESTASATPNYFHFHKHTAIFLTIRKITRHSTGWESGHIVFGIRENCHHGARNPSGWLTRAAKVVRDMVSCLPYFLRTLSPVCDTYGKLAEVEKCIKELIEFQTKLVWTELPETLVTEFKHKLRELVLERRKLVRKCLRGHLDPWYSDFIDPFTQSNHYQVDQYELAS